VAGLIPRDCLPIRAKTQDGQTHARARCNFSVPPCLARKVYSRANSYPSTQSDLLNHKRLRGQIAPKPRFVKMVDFRGYQARQSESPVGRLSVGRSWIGNLSLKPQISMVKGLGPSNRPLGVHETVHLTVYDSNILSRS
jgi:hypothetical protein